MTTDNASIASEGDVDPADTPPVPPKLQRPESVHGHEMQAVAEGNHEILFTDDGSDVLEDLRHPECPAEYSQMTSRRRARVFSFGRRYSPLEQKQKVVPTPSPSLPADSTIPVSNQAPVAPVRSNSSPLKPGGKHNRLRGTKDLLKKAKGSLVNMVTLGRHADQNDVSGEQSLEDLNGYPEVASVSSAEGEGEESQWEEPLEPNPPSWVKHGYVMVGEKAPSGKVKWSQRVSGRGEVWAW